MEITVNGLDQRGEIMGKAEPSVRQRIELYS